VIDIRVFEAIARAEPEDCTPLLAALVARISQHGSVSNGSAPPAMAADGSSTPASAQEPFLLTYQEAAKLLRSSTSYVETLVRQGKIPHVRLPAADKAGRSRAGRLVRLRASDLQAWAAKHLS
jgi:hypothetical protein